jgi:NADP-dependent 3-hydroxy acid dehydrogenase YdfG
MPGQPRPLVPVKADVMSKSDIETAYKTVSSKEECVHLLVNNAGIAGSFSKTHATEPGSVKEDYSMGQSFTNGMQLVA